MATYSILNEATNDYRRCGTLAQAKHAAQAKARETGYDHSVWQCIDSGFPVNTGDYYEGEHGDELI